MRSLFSRQARHPTTPPPPFSGGETPPRRRTPKENVDPSTPAHHPHSGDHASPYRSPSSAAKPLLTRNRSLPPRPPSSNPLKRKLDVSPARAAVGPPPEAAAASDSGVQVVVRIRPPCSVEGEEAGEDGRGPDACVRKMATNSVAIQGQDFTFDAVADAASTQEDLFKLVGQPLVENCLSGFNSSIFAYGQTGSGKTYTMWGPLSAISGDSMGCERGLTPRVFEQLFSRIKEEQGKHKDKELIYNCTCSFLEIYNEQITDLLDPMQKNLQIREDVKTACVYVESLTKEFVFTMKDVTQLLVKGLANRRTGSTSANADSSRSHCVFTCVIKSESKNLEDGSNSIRVSRINLVDLAGSERQKLTHAAGDRLKEAGNINRSLSALGNLINILAEISQSGKQRHVPYRDSKLTFLLQESLGGNAMLAMICAVSPSERCKNETLSTLRFAQRAKAIKNNAVVNEQKEDDVNALHEQIRHLKDELHRMKSNGGSEGGNGSFSTGWNARRSLHLLKMSLNRPTTFQAIKEDSDEEMEIDENDVEKPSNHDMVIALAGDIGFKRLPASEVTNAGLSHVDAFDGDKILMPTKRSCSDANKLGEDRCNLNLAASIQRGLQVIESHQNNGAWRRASVGLNARIRDVLPCKVDVSTQTDPEESQARDNTLALVPSCVVEISSNESKDPDACRDLQLVPADGAVPSDGLKQQQILKAVEKVLAGSIRREMARDEQCAKQAVEIQQLNRLVQQYKHERECNAVIAQTMEGKIARLESLMDGTLPTDEFIHEEYLSLMNEHKILQKKYDNHPEVLRAEIEVKALQRELDLCRNYMDEKEVLQEEIHHLKSQLHYMLSSSASLRRLWPPLQSQQSANPSPGTKDDDGDTNIPEAADYAEAESKWIALMDELRADLEANKSLVGRLRSELESEKKCSEESKEALQTAMQGYTRILEQYADLEERHIGLHAMHRKILDGVEDVKMRAAKAGVKGVELRFLNSLGAEISFLRAENKSLHDQRKDTAEAVQAAGELLVRLKEAEEATTVAQNRALLAEQETEKAYQEIDNLKKNYDHEIVALNQRLTEYSKHNDATPLPAASSNLDSAPRYDSVGGSPGDDQQWRGELDAIHQQGSLEVTKSTDLNSWFSGYDRCNI
ncbi:kinesin-like protein KIN-12A isoform X2 [Aegilops tauschii subsp. strangulata]|nr:kinesin-like protein KIN-12A isoform X1 [Aegilops tauschii subsp. strangulata]XP_044332405.1 kinesin-like protein KIN-12A isoform X1 [Triticum aestivum]